MPAKTLGEKVASWIEEIVPSLPDGVEFVAQDSKICWTYTDSRKGPKKDTVCFELTNRADIRKFTANGTKCSIRGLRISFLLTSYRCFVDEGITEEGFKSSVLAAAKWLQSAPKVSNA
jgi:hypothetical protein